MNFLRRRRCFSDLIFPGTIGMLLFIAVNFLDYRALLTRHKLSHASDRIGSMQVVSETEATEHNRDVDEATESVDVVADNNILKLKQLFESHRNARFNCTKLLQGHGVETEKAMNYRMKFPYPGISEDVIINATNKCDLYKRARGYVAQSSAVERSFPIAYSVVIHDAIDQFERLLRAIYRPQNYYCIHVDRKANKKFRTAVKAITDCFDNVFVASKQEVVVYAGFTRLQADLNCMEELYSKYADWKYVLNAAGTEFPLKSNKELVKLLNVYNGTNVIGKSMRTLNPWRWKRKYETVVKDLKGEIYNTGKSHVPPPFNLTITKGSAYAVFSRTFVDYVLHNSVAREFLEWSRNTYSPDEQFWATLNNLEHNPHLKTPGGDSGTGPTFMSRAVLWGAKRCHGVNIRGICVFGAGDLPWLSQRPEFFANKFKLSVDEIAYTCMEELLKRRETQVEPWDLAFHLEFLKAHRTKY